MMTTNYLCALCNAWQERREKKNSNLLLALVINSFSCPSCPASAVTLSIFHHFILCQCTSNLVSTTVRFMISNCISQKKSKQFYRSEKFFFSILIGVRPAVGDWHEKMAKGFFMIFIWEFEILFSKLGDESKLKFGEDLPIFLLNPFCTLHDCLFCLELNLKCEQYKPTQLHAKLQLREKFPYQQHKFVITCWNTIRYNTKHLFHNQNGF